MDEIVTIVICVSKKEGYRLTIDKVYNVYNHTNFGRYIITDDDKLLNPTDENFISIIEHRENLKNLKK